ncbi:MAG: hypothetical protein P4L93_06585 [Coriobacteriia bacterium]|nr:hypothetical protein [Coriobacteriia bacterium]
MHSSLTLRFNLITIGACVLVAAGTTTLPGAFPMLAWAVAAVFGVVAGDLQSRSIRASSQSFKSARTALEVREALMSNGPGRLTVAIQWVLLPVLLGMAWWSGNIVAGALGGYALFMAVRDLVALRAVVGLTPAESRG